MLQYKFLRSDSILNDNLVVPCGENLNNQVAPPPHPQKKNEKIPLNCPEIFHNTVLCGVPGLLPSFDNCLLF